MSRKLNAGDYGRQDTFTIQLEHIKLGINSRQVLHTREEIIKLAHSIVKHGQLQSALGRTIEDGKVELVAGYGRYEAIKYANQFLCPEKPLPILIRVRTLDDEQAYVASITENLDRKANSAVDDAYAQRRLIDVFHWDEQKVAELYGCSVPWLDELAKLIQLPPNLQQDVKAGTITTKLGTQLAELPTPVAQEIAQQARPAPTAKVDGRKANRLIREAREAVGAPARSRTMVELKEFLQPLTAYETRAVSGLAKALLEFIAGKLTGPEMLEVMDE